MHDDRKPVKPSLYALLIYKDNSTICTKLQYWLTNGELEMREYKEHYVNHILRTNSSLIHLKSPIYALVGNKSDCRDVIPTKILIQDNNQFHSNLKFGVCLHKALFNFNVNDTQLLVDWIELNIALGAEIITIYLQNVSESYYTAMLPYIEKKIVEVLDWNMKPPLVPSYTKDWGQTGTVTECIYRNINRVKYLALIDVDEFIIPQQNSTVAEMMNELEKITAPHNPASYIFYNTWMYNDGISLPEVNISTKCNDMKWPRYYTHTLRANPIEAHKAFHWHKIIVKPEAINAAWYHWALSVKHGYTKEYNVPPQYGLTHHYRIPERIRMSSTRTYTVSRFFNQTLRHLQIC